MIQRGNTYLFSFIITKLYVHDEGNKSKIIVNLKKKNSDN